MAINLRLGWKGAIFTALVPVAPSRAQPVKRVTRDDLIARQAQCIALRDGRRQVVARPWGPGPRPEGGDANETPRRRRPPTVVGVRDEEQRYRAGLSAHQDGRPRLDLFDAEGENRALLYLDDRGRPKVDLDP